MKTHLINPSKLLWLKSHVLFIFLSLAFSGYGQVSGTVFLDFNANGIRENTATYCDAPFEGVTVTGYGADGTVYGPVTSSSTGTYTLPGVNQPTRIEFTWPQDWLYSTESGNTSVQFVSGSASNIDFGLHNPLDYWNNTTQANPLMTIPCYINGTINANSSGDPGWIQVDYNASGLTPTYHAVATAGEVGTIWGVAYQRTAERYFSTAFLKRHSGVGPMGFGGVYIADLVSGNYDLSGSFSLQGVTPANGGAALDFENDSVKRIKFRQEQNRKTFHLTLDRHDEFTQ